MEPLVAGMVLASAVIHPVWYAVVKRDVDPDGAYIAVAGGIALTALVHALIEDVDLIAALAAWPLLLISTAAQFGYGLAVVSVLKRGDLSAYYPIIRSSPLAIVLIGVVILGEWYSPSLLIGIALVLIGAFALQYRRGARLLSEPVNFALAGAAMFASAIYAVSDGLLVRQIDPAAILFWCQALVTPPLAILFKRSHAEWRFGLPLATWRRTPLRYAMLGPMAYLSYLLILAAYRLGANVAAVNSVRQAAIPISVFIGGVWLAEAAMWRRLVAAAVLAIGVVVIVLSK